MLHPALLLLLAMPADTPSGFSADFIPDLEEFLDTMHRSHHILGESHRAHCDDKLPGAVGHACAEFRHMLVRLSTTTDALDRTIVAARRDELEAPIHGPTVAHAQVQQQHRRLRDALDATRGALRDALFREADVRAQTRFSGTHRKEFSGAMSHVQHVDALLQSSYAAWKRIQTHLVPPDEQTEQE